MGEARRGRAVGGAFLLVLAALGAGQLTAQEAGEPGWIGLQFGERGGAVTVLHATHGSPAEAAGIEPGDVVVTVAGLDASGSDHEVPNARGLDAYLRQGKPGQTCTIGLATKGERRKVVVHLVAHDVPAHLTLALRDGAKALASRAAPSRTGWTRHVGAQSKDDLGSAMTALAARALAGLPPDLRKDHETLIDRSLATLVERAKEKGWIEDPAATAGQSYETYATSEALLALVARGGPKDGASIAWLSSGLAARQLGQPANVGPYGGWFEDLDWQYGAFPFEANPIVERANIRATVGGTAIAVEALAAAGMPASDPVLARARHYLERAQNFNADANALLAGLKDGGFPETPFFSKAGFKDVGDDRVFKSYGSATADGLAALVRTGAGVDDPRTKAALEWVLNHYELHLARNPGFEPEPGQPRSTVPFELGIHYYYMASLTRALDALSLDTVMTPQGTRRWGADVVHALLGAQGKDGSWKNPVEVMDEDNEAIATCFALLSLEKALKHIAPPK